MASPWTVVPVPPVPEHVRSRFRAHSVTVAHHPGDLLAPSYGWRDLADVEMTLPEPGSTATSLNDLIESGIAALPAALSLLPGSRLVFLACGTVVVIGPRDVELEFPGFTPEGDHPAAYRIPIHRIRGGKPVAKAFLAQAQLDLDEFCAREPDSGAVARQALGAMAAIGYPNPGMSTSDADVLDIWERRSADQRYMARVQCANQRSVPYNVSTLVQFEGPEPTYPLMRAIADAGRDGFRYDYLNPKVVRVHTVS